MMIPNEPVSRLRSRHRRARATAVGTSPLTHLRMLGLGLAFLAACVFLLAGVARAEETPAEATPANVPVAVSERMKEIISAQIAAFRAEDAEAAYAYASPAIRMRFPTANMFVSMVQRGYPTVYAPQSFNFSDAAVTDRGPVQLVRFVASDGQLWGGLYMFTENDEGELFISGVFLRRQNERQI
ncbi:MAG: DUF4864 domain-containing protein [Cohaesibacteraceae bacterium]